MQSSHNHFIATTKEIQAKHVFYSTNRRLHVSGLVSFSVTIISQALYNAQVTTTLNQAPVDMSILELTRYCHYPVQCAHQLSQYTCYRCSVSLRLSSIMLPAGLRPWLNQHHGYACYDVHSLTVI